MAIIKLGPTVVGIRGTLAGITFSANATGPFARAWNKPSNPRSAYQEPVRAALTQLGELWLSMSDAERQDWRDFAADPPEDDYNSLGELILLSGWQWFCRVNQRLHSVGLDTTTTLPTNSPATAPDSATLTAAPLPTGPITIAWTAGDFPADTSALLYIAAHRTQGLDTKQSSRLLVWAQHEPAGTSATITSDVQARFGNLSTGWKLFGGLYQLRDDGVRSVETPCTAVFS
jgi:hypothetical protein